MTRPLSLRLSPAAAEQIETISDWWRSNRAAAPDLFLDELERAYTLIRSQPDVGQLVIGATSDRVRRVRLRRSRYYVFYQRSDDEGAVEVLAVWHTSRGERPPV